MTDAEKLAMLKVLVDVNGSEQDEELAVYLSLAGGKIIRKAFPFDTEVTEVPRRYGILQCEIAAYLWNKRGAEGETAHSENGISRSYGSADVPPELMNQIIPYCGVIWGTVADEVS